MTIKNIIESLKKQEKIKISATKTGIYEYEWRIPTSGTASGGTRPTMNMLMYSGGTFTNDPTINTTYYTDHQPV